MGAVGLVVSLSLLDRGSTPSNLHHFSILLNKLTPGEFIFAIGVLGARSHSFGPALLQFGNQFTINSPPVSLLDRG